MKIYCYDEDMKLIEKLQVDDPKVAEHYTEVILNGESLREVVAEDMFNHGWRKQSGQLSRVLAVFDGDKKAPTPNAA